MPLPTPNKGETQSKFVSRCIQFLVDENSSLKADARVAACYSQWEKGTKKEEYLLGSSGSWNDTIPEEAEEDIVEDESKDYSKYPPKVRAQTGNTELGWHAALAGGYPELDEMELPESLKPGGLYPGEDEELFKLP